MDFADQLKQFSKRVASHKDAITTEEATKTSLIMPFFSMLGYDIFNPQEFVPEFTADVGIKRGEKVDYAIVRDGKPIILIEAKSVNEKLKKHDSQLFRYFGTTSAKLAILTNGASYRFYTDLEESNRMDEDPFLEINLLDIKEIQIPEIKKFHKDNFDIEEIFDSASVLKYATMFKGIFSEQLAAPSDDLVKLFLQDVYSGLKTQSVIDKFRPILKKSLNDHISETMNEKIKSALKQSEDDTPGKGDAASKVDNEKTGSKIVTTEEELEAYFLIKNILKEFVPYAELAYRDTESYINILYKNNARKWICRLKLTKQIKILILPDESKKMIRYQLESIYDIENYKDKIIEVLERYL